LKFGENKIENYCQITSKPR